MLPQVEEEAVETDGVFDWVGYELHQQEIQKSCTILLLGVLDSYILSWLHCIVVSSILSVRQHIPGFRLKRFLLLLLHHHNLWLLDCLLQKIVIVDRDAIIALVSIVVCLLLLLGPSIL